MRQEIWVHSFALTFGRIFSLSRDQRGRSRNNCFMDLSARPMEPHPGVGRDEGDR